MGVLEVHRPALAVGDPAVAQHLQQDVEHIGVGFLHLIEQHHAVGFAADGLGQLAALFITDVSRRRANQTADAETSPYISVISIRIRFVSSSNRLSA